MVSLSGGSKISSVRRGGGGGGGGGISKRVTRVINGADYYVCVFRAYSLQLSLQLSFLRTLCNGLQQSSKCSISGRVGSNIE